MDRVDTYETESIRPTVQLQLIILYYTVTCNILIATIA